MSNSVEAALKALGEVLSSELKAERARADLAERSMHKLIGGISALIETMPLAANDPEIGDKLPETSRSYVPNEAFFSALTSEWITAAKLRQLLIARGMKIAEGTIYNRMRKLVAKFPDKIEAAVEPERWRLKEMPKPRKKIVSRRAQPSGRNSNGLANSNLNTIVSASEILPIESGDKLTGIERRDLWTDALRPTLHHGDCLEVMKTLRDESVDLILADLPYGTTRLGIDQPLPLDELWSEYRRILRKPHGNIVLFGSQPFSTTLINAASDIFRYALVWDKNSSTGFQHADSKPLKRHEDILVFSYGVNISAKRTKRRATYNDIHAVPIKRTAKGRSMVTYLDKAIRGYPAGHEFVGRTNCQTSILQFPKDSAKVGYKTHPFAKPVALLEHLIRTYSDEGGIVLDNTMGSGSTCIAAMRAGRHSIGIEKDMFWFDQAVRRVAEELDGRGFARKAA